MVASLSSVLGLGSFEAPRRFELEIGALRGSALQVVSFEGEEAISELFTYRVEVLTELPFEVVEPLVFGQMAKLVIRGRAERRVVRGIVRGVHGRDAVHHRGDGGPRTRLSIELMPRLAMARECRRNRIFQDQTVAEIVTGILADWGIESEWRLLERHGAWPYCVQYEESDFDFVRRILAGEGISFHFVFDSLASAGMGALGALVDNDVLSGALSAAEDLELGERIVFGDSPQSHSGIVGLAPRLRVVPDHADHASGLGSGEECISAFAVRRVLAPRAVVMRDYNACNALHEPRATASARTTIGSPSDGVGAVAAAVQQALSEPTGVRFDDRLAEIYEHAPQRSPGGSVLPTAAHAVLEAHQRLQRMASGTSNSHRLIPGHVFSIDEHSVASLDGGYVVTRLRCRGVTPESANATAGSPVVYSNEIEAASHDVSFRPPRQARPAQQTLETAVVVGPEGEEISTDALGRIKVRFHWDVGDTANESRSCWIRVMQSWAGPLYGTHYTPRVGMEVLVSFVGGDIDRPVVIGCMANSSTPSHVPLPRDKTRSGIRTRSSPYGLGFNELTFEDANGSEKIYLRAERDLDEWVRHDHTAKIGRDDHTVVAGQQTLAVGHDRTTTIDHDDRLRVHGSRDVAITGDQSHRVEGAESCHVGGGSTLVVDAGRDVHVGGDETQAVSGARRTHVGHDASTVVLGTERTFVHGEAHRVVERTAIAELHGCTVVSVGTPAEERALVTHVEGQSRAESSKELELVSHKSIRLTCGKSTILIGPEAIQISTPKLVLEGKRVQSFGEAFHVVARDVAHLKAAAVHLSGATGEISLTSDVKIGRAVKLGVPAEQDRSPAAEVAHARPTSIHLRDDHGGDVPGQAFVLRGADGTERAGVLDHEGKAELLGLAGEWTIEFPTVMHVRTAQ